MAVPYPTPGSWDALSWGKTSKGGGWGGGVTPSCLPSPGSGHDGWPLAPDAHVRCDIPFCERQDGPPW